MRGGRVFSIIIAFGCVLLSPGARAESLSLRRLLPPLSASLRLPPNDFRRHIASTARSEMARTLSFAHQVFRPVQDGPAGSLTDPLSARASPFPGGRQRFGSIAWENFGGPAFVWATPSREMCDRTGACPINVPTTQVVVPTLGGVLWTGGSGPVVRFGRRTMELGALGQVSLSLEGSFFGVFVGHVSKGSGAQQMSVGTDAGAGVAIELRRVAIRLQLQTVLYLVEERASQPIASQFLTAMAIGWR
jgi:hypothetical protein